MNKTPEQKFQEHFKTLSVSDTNDLSSFYSYERGWLACHAEMEENYRQKSIEFNFKILVENEELETKIKNLESQLATKVEKEKEGDAVTKFYSDEQNWQGGYMGSEGNRKCIVNDSESLFHSSGYKEYDEKWSPTINFGGKRAREYCKKWGIE